MVGLAARADTRRPCWPEAGTAGSQHKPALIERKTPRLEHSLVDIAELVVVAVVEHTLGCSAVVVAA